MSSPCVANPNAGSVQVGPINPQLPALERAADVVQSWPRTRRRRALHIAGDVLVGLPLPAWVLIDAVIVWLAMVQGYHWFAVAEFSHHVQPWLAYGVFTSALFICGLIFGLNERSTFQSRGHTVTRMALTTGLAAVLAYAVIYVMLYLSLSRRVAMLTVGTYFVLGTSIRLFACYAIRRTTRRVLVVGRKHACESFVDRLKDSYLTTHSVIGWVHNPDEKAQKGKATLSCLGTTDGLVRICRDMNVQDIVVCNGSAKNPKVMEWMLPCLRMGCRVTNEATFYESSVGQILVDEITPDWFLFTDLRAHCHEYATMKRFFDVIVALIGLVVSLPLYPILALAIKLEDGGPVFYTQDRVGKGGRVFKLYKFRTMKIDAENGQSVWAKKNDPRTTRVGRFIRRTRLDEFPQFLNILVGTMSVVGPRPERPDIVKNLRSRVPYWSERNLVKPGLTGWAQISFRYGNSVEDAKRKLQFDFYYLKHMSLELDILILFRTLGTFLRGAC